MVLMGDDAETIHEARRMLLGLARHRFPDWSDTDREDLAHDALAKALGQHQVPGGTPLHVRARVTFRDEWIDRLRKGTRTPEDLYAEPPDDRIEPSTPEAALELAELCVVINVQLGHDALALAVLRARDYTYAEIAAQSGWDTARVDRARAQLRRKQELVQNILQLPPSQRKEAS
jgi:DNA-directed RNA polymerase specialized sigma24 family protein